MYTERAESSVFPSPRFIPDPPHGGKETFEKPRKESRLEAWNGMVLAWSTTSACLLFIYFFFLSFSFSIPVRLLATRISTRLDPRSVCNNDVVVFSRAVNWLPLAGGKRSYRVSREERRTGGKGWLSTLNGPSDRANHAPLVNPLISQRTVVRFDGSIDCHRCYISLT